VSFGHWSFLRILWDTDGLTQRELRERAEVMEPHDLHHARRHGQAWLHPLRAGPRGQPQGLHPTDPGRPGLEGRAGADSDGNERDRRARLARGRHRGDRRTLLAMVANLAKDEIEAAQGER